MGNQPSTPKSGASIQVIGAGLSRTGTASFSEALSILLDGPVYHGGTQAILGDPVEMKSWIKILSHFPARDEADRKIMSRMISERLDGFVGVTDLPACGLVPELLELYPNAKVICTVRDTEAWAKSMAGLSSVIGQRFLRVILFPLPGMRHFVDFLDALSKQWANLFGDAASDTTLCYHRHMEYLRTNVPEDRLVFFNVKDGWEPLCKALGKEVPHDKPFPRINDKDAIEKQSQRIIKEALVRWGLILATTGILVLLLFFVKETRNTNKHKED